MEKRPPLVRPAALQKGDIVRLISPASTPSRAGVDSAVDVLTKLGLQAEVAPHVFDKCGYMAGKDEDRLADLNDSLRDPAVKAVIATRGGKGAYRLAADVDFAAMREHPKLLIGFSDITVLQMAILKHCGTTALHGAPWDADTFGMATADSFVKAAFTTEPVMITATTAEPTSSLTTSGQVTGSLIGGNQDSVAISSGWALPPLDGAILLLEAVNLRLGHIDRQLTMLQNAGYLDRIVGVAVGQYTDCEPDATTQGSWTALDVLRDRLSRLAVPILGGLAIGHGNHPIAVPIGPVATLDADAGTLVVEPAVS